MEDRVFIFLKSIQEGIPVEGNKLLPKHTPHILSPEEAGEALSSVSLIEL